MNSNQKGKRGERAWRDELRAQGYLQARRGQQFSGSPDSPDVVCPELDWAHFEVKCVERLNVQEAMEQACWDSHQKCSEIIRNEHGQHAAVVTYSKRKVPVVAHKKNHGKWLVTMLADDWFKFIRNK